MVRRAVAGNPRANMVWLVLRHFPNRLDGLVHELGKAICCLCSMVFVGFFQPVRQARSWKLAENRVTSTGTALKSAEEKRAGLTLGRKIGNQRAGGLVQFAAGEGSISRVNPAITKSVYRQGRHRAAGQLLSDDW